MVAQETQTTTHADRYRAAAAEFARRLTHALGDQVDSIVLYGSAARGVASELDYEGGFTSVISAFTIEPDELLRLRRLGSPLVRNVLREGHILYDNDTFARIPDMTEGPSQEYIARQLESADEAIEDADFLLKGGRYKAAPSFAYYAMF